MKHLGTEVELEIGEKRYTFSRFTRKLLRQFHEWALTRLPNLLPLYKEMVKTASPEAAKVLADQALKYVRLRKSLYNPEIQELMKSEAGLIRILWLLLKKHHPDLTEDEAGEVFDELGEERVDALIVQTSGQMPKDEGQVEREVMVEAGLLPRPLPRTFDEEEDWLKIDQSLIKYYHFRPWELEEFTLTEILVYSSVERPEQPDLDIECYLEAYRNLSPTQKIDIAERLYT